MTVTSFDAERTHDDERFSAVEVFQSGRIKVVCGYFELGQFISVHAPNSDVAIHVREGIEVIRDGDEEHRVKPDGVVVIEADTDRGIKADDDAQPDAFLVTAPPPSDTEHGTVREGIKRGAFNSWVRGRDDVQSPQRRPGRLPASSQ